MAALTETSAASALAFNKSKDMEELYETREQVTDSIRSEFDMAALVPPGGKMSVKSGFYFPGMAYVSQFLNKNAPGSLTNTCKGLYHFSFI